MLHQGEGSDVPQFSTIYAVSTATPTQAQYDAINGALEELQADGTLQAIVDKYITAE